MPSLEALASSESSTGMTRTILLYDASWNTLGGGEKYLCTMAEVLSTDPRNEVFLILDNPTVTGGVLRSRFGLDLERVQYRVERRTAITRVLGSADIGITVSNFSPLGNHAKRNVCILQMPYRAMNLRTVIDRISGEGLRESAKDLFRRQLLRDARRASLVLTYSEFTRDNLSRLHDIHAEVLYPPIDDFSGGIPKEAIILSVGRFFRGLYNDKRYDILIRAFIDLCRRLPPNSWEYHLVGSCGSDRRSVEYVDYLRKLAGPYPVHFHLNVPYSQVRGYYQRATFFWHGAGFGVEEERFPDRAEHFGMSTVEAMSARCIPFGVNAGGQKEIIESGKSGYLWSSVDELVCGTMHLIQNPEDLPSVQREARERYLDFSRERFSEHLLRLLG